MFTTRDCLSHKSPALIKRISSGAFSLLLGLYRKLLMARLCWAGWEDSILLFARSLACGGSCQPTFAAL